MKILILIITNVLFLISITSSVYAGVSSLLDAPTEAFTLDDLSSAPSSCQSNYLCDDGNFSSATDIWTVIRDENTGTGAFIRNATNPIQDQVIKIIFDIDGLTQGNYFLRYYSTLSSGS